MGQGSPAPTPVGQSGVTHGTQTEKYSDASSLTLQILGIWHGLQIPEGLSKYESPEQRDI